MSEVGIKETKEILKFAIELGEGLDKAFEDKQFSVTDIGLVVAPLMSAPAAFSGLGQFDDEMKDLSAEEKAELVDFVENELDIQSDRTEELIEKGLDLALSIYQYTKLFKKEEA